MGPPALSPAAPALFLNYDISHTASSSSGASFVHDTSALTEIGLAFGGGTLISSQTVTNLGNNDASQARQWRRLETTWTQDFQKHNLTLRLGDTSARPSMWGRSLYFGGLQFGSNFGLTPGFMSQPIPIVSGTASGPGTVELYVNNALRQTSNVPTGPFTIENFSPLTGAGEARVVVRDLLGRESVLVQPFFTNNNLLAPGLSDWSVSLGRERYNLGIENSDYRDGFASGLYRRGLSDNLTIEGQANVSEARQNMGMGVNAAIPFQSLGQLALAQSHDTLAGNGHKLLLGIDKQTLRSGFSARWVLANRDYRELGLGPTELPYQHELSINYRHTFENQNSMTLSTARLDSYETGANNMLSASYSMRVGERGALIFSGTQVSGNATGYTLGVSLVLPLESRKTVTSSLSSSSNASDGYAAVSSPLSGEVGTGWRALGGYRGGEALAEGGVYYQGNKAFLGADVSATGSAQALRLNVQGALVAMGGSVFTARRLSDSFALVEVRGYPDVGVGFQGATLTRTDENGLALLASLAAYQRNSIRLDPNDLPFSAELDSIEQTVVPAWRGGVKVTFPVRTGRGALLRLLLADGEPAHQRVFCRAKRRSFCERAANSKLPSTQMERPELPHRSDAATEPARRDPAGGSFGLSRGFQMSSKLMTTQIFLILRAFSFVCTLILATTSQAANYTCSLGSISNVSLNYDPNTQTATTATGSVTVNCAKSGGSGSALVYLELGSDGGIHASGSQSRGQNGSNTLNYGVWRDSNYTQAWASASSSRLKASINSSSSNTSYTFTYYFSIPAQQNAAAGNYTDTQTIRLYQSNTALGASTASSSGSTSLNITLVTLARCTLSSPPGNIQFNYTSFQIAVASASTSFAVTCVSGVPYTMALDASSGTLVGLDYSLSLSKTGTQTGSGVAQSASINASMAAGQAGTCSSGSCTASQARTLTITY